MAEGGDTNGGKSLEELIFEEQMVDSRSLTNIIRDGKKKKMKTTANGEGRGMIDKVNMSLDEIIRKENEAFAVVSSKPAVAVAADTDRVDLGKSLDQIIKERKILVTNTEGNVNGNQSLLPLSASGLKMIGGEEGWIGKKRKRSIGECSVLTIDDEGYEECHATPLEVIRKLTETDGLVFEQEIKKVEDEDVDKSRSWQSAITSGGVSAKVEASYKELAKQCAAMKMVEILKELHPTFAYPKCAIPEGCFYDLSIVAWLESNVGRQGLPAPEFDTVQKIRDKKDYFITKCKIGEDEFEGRSFNADYSKIFAAKSAFETYAQRRCPRGRYHVIEDAGDADEEGYCETETQHNVCISVKMMTPGEEN